MTNYDAELTVEDLAEALKTAGAAVQEEGRPDVTVEAGRKRGPRPKAEAPPATVSYTGEDLIPLVQALDGWLSASLLVTPKSVDQCREIAAAMAPVLTKYAGATIERWGPEMALVAILAKNYVPTYLEFSAMEKVRKAEEQPTIVVDSQTRTRA